MSVVIAMMNFVSVAFTSITSFFVFYCYYIDNMRNLFICILFMFCMGCEVTLVPSSNPVYQEEEYIVEYGYCSYDPLPYSYPMNYCTTYSEAECCVWEEWDISWSCAHEWCFYWDTCTWEHVESECW